MTKNAKQQAKEVLIGCNFDKQSAMFAVALMIREVKAQRPWYSLRRFHKTKLAKFWEQVVNEISNYKHNG